MKQKIFCLICFIFFSGTSGIFSQNYGVVLSGGGAKGAYEIGVWKAFEEYGIAQKTTILSGTSVGGLNAAMFSCLNLEQSKYLWREIVPYELTADDKLLNQDGVKKILDVVDLSQIQKNLYPKIYVTAVKDRFTMLKIISSIFLDHGDKTVRFLLNDEKNIAEIKNKLLATSAVPYLTQPVELADGHKYIDGGLENYGGDNTPIAPLVDNHKELDAIFVVYLYANPNPRIDVSKYPQVPIIEIIPSRDLGGMLGSLDFSVAKIDKIMDQGYNDAVSVLDNLGMKKVSSFWFE